MLGTSENESHGTGCALLAQNIFSSCAIRRMGAYSWSFAATKCLAWRAFKTGASWPSFRPRRARANLSRSASGILASHVHVIDIGFRRIENADFLLVLI